MKKSGLLKSLVVVLLSGVLVANLATFVFADDNLSWEDLSSDNNTNTENIANNTLEDNNTNLNSANNTVDNNTNYSTSGNLSTNLSTNSSNTNVNENKNELAYTGFADNSILPVMIVLGILVTVYSVKKIKEYNF